MCNSCNIQGPTSTSVEAINSNDVPVYADSQISPTSFIPMVVEQPSACDGKTMALYHLPVNRLIDTGGIQTNVYSVHGGGSKFSSTASTDCASLLINIYPTRSHWCKS